MQLFRRRGFATVSVRDIESATGLHATSLYKAYGSKEGLFVAALTAYNEMVVRKRVVAHLEGATSPTEGIRAYFGSLFDADVANDPGCLITNTAVESFVLEGRSRERAGAGLEIIRAGLEAAVTAAIQHREVTAELDPSEVSRQLLAFYQGVLVLIRFGTAADELELLVHGTLDRLLPH